MSFWYFGKFLYKTILFRPIALIFQVVFRIITGAHLPINLSCGKKLHLAYGGSGVVVHRDVVIGDNVLISPGVVIGGKGGTRVPIIGNNVQIMPGAKILGDIFIADGTFIGVNAVLLEDTVPNSKWISSKAREI